MMRQDHHCHIPTPEIKEQLHHLPKGYTKHGALNERTRARLLTNGWHAGVALYFLTLIMHTFQAQCRPLLRPNPLGHRPIGQMATTALAFGIYTGPGPLDPPPQAIGFIDDPEQHWRECANCYHPLHQRPILEPGLANCINTQRHFKCQWPQIR